MLVVKITLDKYMNIKKINNYGILRPNNEDYYLCPYCGYVDRLIEFRLLMKHGNISERMCKCKKCENSFKLRTLKILTTIEDWCKWLYYNIRMDEYGSDFYHKINWDLLKLHLNIYNIANDFWDTWKEIKATYNKEEANNFFNELYKSQSKRVTLSSFDNTTEKSSVEIRDKKMRKKKNA